MFFAFFSFKETIECQKSLDIRSEIPVALVTGGGGGESFLHLAWHWPLVTRWLFRKVGRLISHQNGLKSKFIVTCLYVTSTSFGLSPWERGYCVISKCDWKSTWCQLKYPSSACTRPHSLASLHNWKAWNLRIKKVVFNVGRIRETF